MPPPYHKPLLPLVEMISFMSKIETLYVLINLLDKQLMIALSMSG